MIVILLLLSVSFYANSITNNKITNESNHRITSMQTASSPITVNGNAQFQSVSSSGNGTKSNPYIINNLLITSVDSNGDSIDIQNTDAYFIIENNVIEST